MESKDTSLPWPVLDFGKIKDTLETLHQWIQIVGKIRLRTMPWQNHSWHTTLYLSPHGLTTQGIPYQERVFQIDFDFLQHQLFITAPTFHRLCPWSNPEHGSSSDDGG